MERKKEAVMSDAITARVVGAFSASALGAEFLEIFAILTAAGLRPLGKSNTSTLLFQRNQLEGGSPEDVLAFRCEPSAVLSFPISFWGEKEKARAELCVVFDDEEMPRVINRPGSSSRFSAGQVKFDSSTFERIRQLCLQLCTKLMHDSPRALHDTSATELLNSLRPRTKQRVYDVLIACGFDLTHWGVLANGKPFDRPAENRNQNSEWSYRDPATGVVVLNLWYSKMGVRDDEIVYAGNFNDDAMHYARLGENYRQLRGEFKVEAQALYRRGQRWSEQARAVNSLLIDCFGRRTDIRVAIVDREDGGATSSDTPKARELDLEPWHLRSFDLITFDFLLVRGSGAVVEGQAKVGVESSTGSAQQISEYIALPALTAESYGIGIDDQFVEAGQERLTKQVNYFARDPENRRQVLIRSRGHCEYCGEAGFLKANGKRYLETHHIIPLSEGGLDDPASMIALCAGDHRRAHYSSDALRLRVEFQRIVSGLTVAS